MNVVRPVYTFAGGRLRSVAEGRTQGRGVPAMVAPRHAASAMPRSTWRPSRRGRFRRGKGATHGLNRLCVEDVEGDDDVEVDLVCGGDEVEGALEAVLLGRVAVVESVGGGRVGVRGVVRLVEGRLQRLALDIDDLVGTLARDGAECVDVERLGLPRREVERLFNLIARLKGGCLQTGQLTAGHQEGVTCSCCPAVVCS